MKRLTLDEISYLAANGTSGDPDCDLTLLARQYLELQAKVRDINKIDGELQFTPQVFSELRNPDFVKSLSPKLYPEIIHRLAVRCHYQKKQSTTIRAVQIRLARQLNPK